MARPLRVLYPNAWYHVMNRGIDHQDIFVSDAHYYRFLRLLEEAHELYKIELHAYCLMRNHYHLFIKTPLPNLSEAMRYINSGFACIYNKILGRDGPVFKGRFTSILVDKQSYFLQLSRYIHLNPVSAKIVENPQHYPWSSYQFFLQPKNKPNFLYLEETLLNFNNKIDLYEKFVSTGIDDETKNFFSRKRKDPIWGSKNFIKEIEENNNIIYHEEIPTTNNIIKKNLPNIEHVISTVAKIYKVEVQSILNVPKKNYLPRNLSIFLAIKYSRKTQKFISEIFKNISRSAISKIFLKIQAELKTNKKLIETNNLILNELGVRSGNGNSQFPT